MQAYQTVSERVVSMAPNENYQNQTEVTKMVFCKQFNQAEMSNCFE